MICFQKTSLSIDTRAVLAVLVCAPVQVREQNEDSDFVVRRLLLDCG